MFGGKVVVTVKHAAVDGKTPVAYYVDGDGNRTRVAEQYYDAEKEEMTMVLDHFSIYTIVDESPAGEEIPATGPDATFRSLRRVLSGRLSSFRPACIR